MSNPKILDMMELAQKVDDQPFTAMVINRTHLHCMSNAKIRDALLGLSSSDEPVLQGDSSIDWDDIMVQHPQVVETVAIHLGNMKSQKLDRHSPSLLRLIKQAAHFSLKNRKPWQRGKVHNVQKGTAVPMLSRLNHFGELGWVFPVFLD